MTREQKIVLTGAISGFVAMIVAMALLTHLLLPPAGSETLEGRIAITLRCNLAPALLLFAMLGAIGNGRFVGAAIDPTRGAEDRKTIINGRVADNTTQQFLIFLAATLGLATSLPPEDMNVIPAATIVFVTGRLLFWIGYRIDPLYRAFGFASSAYLNAGLIIAALWSWLG
jgi:hypothetical protein